MINLVNEIVIYLCIATRHENTLIKKIIVNSSFEILSSAADSCRDLNIFQIILVTFALEHSSYDSRNYTAIFLTFDIDIYNRFLIM